MPDKAVNIKAWFPFYTGDYLSATGHLSTLEHGAYILLIVHYWSTGKPLPNDDKKLSRISRLTVSEWMEIKDEIMEFFIQEGGILKHKRIEKEIEKAQNLSSKRKESGARGAQKRWESDKVTPFGASK